MENEFDWCDFNFMTGKGVAIKFVDGKDKHVVGIVAVLDGIAAVTGSNDEVLVDNGTTTSNFVKTSDPFPSTKIEITWAENRILRFA